MEAEARSVIMTTAARLERLERKRASSRNWHRRRHELGRCHVASCPNDVTENPDTGKLFWQCRRCRIKTSARVAGYKRNGLLVHADGEAQNPDNGIAA